jgi:tRNA 2-selenouridine synthase
MPASLPIADFLLAAQQQPVIDVRSPAEFDKGHIPGAVNIPLFSNEERALVGTKYKKSGKDEAVLMGLEFVGPKMASFVKQSAALTQNGKVLVHCWRGGMRSSSFAWLLNTAGIQATTLQRGYKAYRHLVKSRFEKPYRLVVLGGETGSGKTAILHELAKLGEQVVDLEGLAHHKGSSFGSLGQLPQPAVEAFENNLSEVLSRLDSSRIVWVEDESRSIGRVFIPDTFWAQMKSAPLLCVQVPKSERIKRLVTEYGQFKREELEAAIQRIQKRLGGQSTKECMDALEAGELGIVADLTLSYYDKAYNHNHADRKPDENYFTCPLPADAPEQSAKDVLAFVKKID